MELLASYIVQIMLLRVVYREIAGLLSNHAMQQHTDTDSLPTEIRLVSVSSTDCSVRLALSITFEL